jgi:hypothetical protein
LHIHKIDQESLKKATKLILKWVDILHKDSLGYFHLTTVDNRRLKDDSIEALNNLKNIDDGESSKFFVVSEAQTRDHSLKLFKTGCNLGRVPITTRCIDFDARHTR